MSEGKGLIRLELKCQTVPQNNTRNAIHCCDSVWEQKAQKVKGEGKGEWDRERDRERRSYTAVPEAQMSYSACHLSSVFQGYHRSNHFIATQGEYHWKAGVFTCVCVRAMWVPSWRNELRMIQPVELVKTLQKERKKPTHTHTHTQQWLMRRAELFRALRYCSCSASATRSAACSRLKMETPSGATQTGCSDGRSDSVCSKHSNLKTCWLLESSHHRVKEGLHLCSSLLINLHAYSIIFNDMTSELSRQVMRAHCCCCF